MVVLKRKKVLSHLLILSLCLLMSAQSFGSFPTSKISKSSSSVNSKSVMNSDSQPKHENVEKESEEKNKSIPTITISDSDEKKEEVKKEIPVGDEDKDIEKDNDLRIIRASGHTMTTPIITSVISNLEEENKISQPIAESSTTVEIKSIPLPKRDSFQLYVDQIPCDKENSVDKVEFFKFIKSLSPVIELEHNILNISAHLVLDGIKKLSDSILTNRSCNSEEIRLLSDSLYLYKKHLEEFTIKRIHEIVKDKKVIDDDEKAALSKILDMYLRPIWSDDRNNKFKELYEHLAVECNNKIISLKAKEIALYAEYYSKYIHALIEDKGKGHSSSRLGSSGRGQKSDIKISVNGYVNGEVLIKNENHTLTGVKQFLFGDENKSGSKREGAIGSYNKWVEIRLQVKAQQEALEERKEKIKEIVEDRKERIEDGEKFSPLYIKKAKFHYERYQYYYKMMEKRCGGYPLYNSVMCERAKKQFNQYGLGIHLKKMFQYQIVAKKYQQLEEGVKKAKMDEIQKLMKEYLPSEHTFDINGDINLSINDDDIDSALLDNEFSREGSATIHDAFMGESDRMWENRGNTNTMNFGNRVPGGNTNGNYFSGQGMNVYGMFGGNAGMGAGSSMIGQGMGIGGGVGSGFGMGNYGNVNINGNGLGFSFGNGINGGNIFNVGPTY